MKHNDLFRRNISKLQKEKYLPNQLRIFAQLIEVGKSAKKTHFVYALTRHQTERLIMDFSGTKARSKKFEILMRLQSIEEDVLKGFYQQAREKASVWGGVQLLQELGFVCSLSNNIAIKKDIVKFLQVPAGTLNSFLRKNAEQIVPIKLSNEQIISIGSKAYRLYGYTLDDVLKIAFWMNSVMCLPIRKNLLGGLGLGMIQGIKRETEWNALLPTVFSGLGFHHNYPIEGYRVDFFIQKLGLGLECDTNNHCSYNQEKERIRDEAITSHYALIRFNSNVDLDSLINAILKVQAKEVVKLYL